MVIIIEYKAGNLKSVERVLRYIGVPCTVTRDPDKILSADRIIFPGVGAAGSAIEDLKRGRIPEIMVEAFNKGIPILGICLGAQIILSHSEENNTDCLGLIKGTARKFPDKMLDRNGMNLKVPHMGWNEITQIQPHPVLNGIRAEEEFYFVHTYYPEPVDKKHIFCTSEYGFNFPCVIGKENLLATQFHPEKSGKSGLKLLTNFMEWNRNVK